MYNGTDFLEKYGNKHFIVLTNKKDEYIPGLNSHCDGINFISSEYLAEYLYKDNKPYMFYHTVKIPNDVLICHVCNNVFNSDKLILSEAKSIKDHILWNDEIFCLKVVIRYKGSLRYVVNQTPMICLLAVSVDGDSLKYVKKQDNDICLEALKNNGLALHYVKINQTNEMCTLAVQNHPGALCYVKNQTDDLCMMAVKKAGWLLKYVKMQSEEICLAAIDNWINAYYDVQIKTSKIIRAAIEKSGHIITSIDLPSDELILLAVKTYPQILGFKKFTDHFPSLFNLYPELVKINGLCLEFIPNQTNQLCMDAITQNGFALYYVKDKNIYEQLYNIGYRQISKHYEKLFKLIDKLKNPEKRYYKYVEKNMKHDKIIKLRKQYEKLYDLIFWHLDNFDKIQKIFDYYNIEYKTKKEFDKALQYDNLENNHEHLLISIILSDIDLVYDYLVSDGKILLTQPLDIKNVDTELHEFLLELDQKPEKVKSILETFEEAEKSMNFTNYMDSNIN